MATQSEVKKAIVEGAKKAKPGGNVVVFRDDLLIALGEDPTPSKPAATPTTGK